MFKIIVKKSISAIKQARTDYKKNKKYIKGHVPARKYVQDHQLPDLTEEQKKSINQFWAKYGVKFDDYCWFQMYYDITGIIDPRFIPNNFASTALYPYYESRVESKVWADKNEFSRILPDLRFPEALAQHINGWYYDADRKCYGRSLKDTFIEKLYKDVCSRSSGSFILKKARSTYQGKGVKKHSVSNPSELKKILSSAEEDDYIIQIVIRQHPFFSQFNKSSVNIVRITTWRSDDGVHIFSPCIRFGIYGANTDVAFVDGQEIVNAIGINKDGTVFDYSVNQDGIKKSINPEIKKVPKWDEMVELVKHNHCYLDYFDVVAWDITVNKDEEVVCIEYNINSPGTVVYQMAQGPMAGEYTEKYLEFLKRRKNQKSYLPSIIRLYK